MRRLAIVASALLLVVSIAGFVGSLILNAFVLDNYDAYGEVPVPGTQTLQLPAGEVKVSFHSQLIGSTGGSGLPVPDLGMTIVPPTGVADPTVTEHVGSTTTVNGDAHRQVWAAQIPEAGNYTIRTDGKVSAFFSPRLSFGHGSSMGFLPWLFAGLFMVSLLGVVASSIAAGRRRKAMRQPVIPETFGYTEPSFGTGIPASSTPAEPYLPTDEGVRLQQLKTLAALHSSGALTDDEFQAEKRRVLGG
jgi:hypothetical protein